MNREQILKELGKRLKKELTPFITEKYNKTYIGDFRIEGILVAICKILSEAIDQTREETIREEIDYWKDVFDNRPKDRDLESDNIAQNFARIEIERLENKLKK